MERPNFILTNTCHVEDYKSPSRRAKNHIVVRDRVEHGEKLKSQLSAALKDNEDLNSYAIAERDGIYLEFRGEKGEDLAITSLESLRQGIRLLNVRSEDETQFATVFIPTGKESYFLNKIEKYADDSNFTKNGKIPHAALLSNIESIRLALVDALWTGSEKHRPSTKKKWIEVWLRTENGKEEELWVAFRDILNNLNIAHRNTYLLFPERMVTLVQADKNDLSSLMMHSDVLAEIRESSTVASFFTNLEGKDQQEWVADLLSRVSFLPGDVSVCLLDSGINEGHPLLNPIVDKDVVLSVDDNLSAFDRDNHGTRLAGIVAYDDLNKLLESSSSITINHSIESIKIYDQIKNNEPELYGEIAKEAIDLAYIAKQKSNRIFCSGVTADETEITDGHPTSWSAALDEAISHPDDSSEEHELVLVSGGNITLEMLNGTSYPEANEVRAVRSPGQSWNALTVGAYCDNSLIREEAILSSGYLPVARENELSPFSTTSLTWRHNQSPIKPEIICPGGNAICKDNDYSDCQDLSLLTTGANVLGRPLDTINATSAAVAKASYIAAELENAYPNLWPETIRGLIVHSARWSKEMKDYYCPEDSPEDCQTKGRRRLLRACGYGIPDLSRAIECKTNSVNLIIQGSFRPFKEEKNRDMMNEMHFHTLPWPREVLQSLSSADALLRITLSYYIEPGPGQIGWNSRYRYPSHGLRFDVNKPGETLYEFQRRINVSMRDETEKSNKASSGSGGWYLGTKNRDVGSIHSDFKTMTAADLSDIEYLAVYPVIGWWRSRKHLGKINSIARYSLIVSVETPAENVDLYSEIANKIELASPVAT